MSVVCVDTNVVIEIWSVSECGECKYNYLSVENVETMPTTPSVLLNTFTLTAAAVA